MTRLSTLYKFALIAFVFGMVMYFLPYVLPEDTVSSMVREDSLIENLTAFCFFLAFVFFLGTFFVTKSGNEFGPIKIPRNLIYLGLAFIFIFGAGEEISWGQRIFGFECDIENNVQEECTIHNIEIFDSANDESWLKMSRLFVFFWFGFAIVVPLTAWASTAMREFLVKLGMPLVPLILGWQFLFFYILSKTWEPFGVPNDGGRITEIREVQHAVLFFLIALYFFLEARKHNAAQAVAEKDSA